MGMATADNYSSWGDFRVILVGYATIIGIGGVIGNGLVIFLFMYFKCLRTVSNNFIINLALCDLIIAILDLIFSIPSLFASRWIFGPVLGVLYAFCHFFLVSSSMVMLAVIAVDRYHVIARPKLGTKITTLKSLFVIIVVYAYTFAIVSPILYAPAGLEVMIYASGCYIDFTPTSNFGSGSYAIVVMSFLYVVPLFTIAFYYWKIFCVLKRRRKRSGKGEAEQNRRCYDKQRGMPGNRTPIQRQPVKTLRLMSALVGLFLATWTPYMVTLLGRSFDQKGYFTDYAKEITILLTKSVVVINPVAYALVNHRFQKCVTKLFCCAQVVLGGTTTDNSIEMNGGVRGTRSSQDYCKWRLSRQDNQREATFVYTESPLIPYTANRLVTTVPNNTNDTSDGGRLPCHREEYQELTIDGTTSRVTETDCNVTVTMF